jgi:hypothetical protein
VDLSAKFPAWGMGPAAPLALIWSTLKYLKRFIIYKRREYILNNSKRNHSSWIQIQMLIKEDFFIWN